MPTDALNVATIKNGSQELVVLAQMGLLIVELRASLLTQTNVKLFQTRFGMTINAVVDQDLQKSDSNAFVMVLKSEIFATSAHINLIQNLTSAPTLVNVPNALLKLEDYALKKINKLKIKIQTNAMLELTLIKIIRHA